MKKLLFFIIAIPLIYSGIWFYIAHQIKKEAHYLYDVEAPNNGYQFLGDKPKISGFPAKHTITLEKGLQIENTKIEFDTATIKTIPLPNQPIEVNVNQIAIYDDVVKQLYEIDTLEATIIAPKSLPTTLTQKDLVPWQQQVGTIEFKDIKIVKNEMRVHAHGPIGLDENLQPAIHLKTKMTDYDKLIHFMTAETSELSPIAGAIALSVLNGMAQTDKDTGQKYVEFDFIAKDQKLTIGPIKSMRVPRITWPKE